jgi:hypothetical protein
METTHDFKILPHHWIKLMICSLALAGLEWLIIQVFRDYIGFSNLEAWIIGAGINLIYILAAVRNPRELIDPMFL